MKYNEATVATQNDRMECPDLSIMRWQKKKRIKKRAHKKRLKLKNGRDVKKYKRRRKI